MATKSVEFPAGEPWIAVDWGTSRLRAWLVQGVAHTHTSEPIITHGPGMSQLAADEFETTLLDAIRDHLPQSKHINVVACGMVGAKQGWFEAPYRSIPCKPVAGDQLVSVPTQSDHIKVYIVPGISQANPADVMRGEETLIAGLMQLKPKFTGTVCLPGTHCKWVSLASGQITAFNTTMTGELFALISQQSILSSDINPKHWDEKAFVEAIKQMSDNPEQLIRLLFSVRANSLLNGADHAKSTARLSGLLIGSDVASFKMHLKQNEIIIIGESALARHYQTALQEFGHTSTSLSMDTLLLEGLKQVVNAHTG